jgi:hypothetical protein
MNIDILQKIKNKKKDDLYFIQMEEAPFYFKIGRTKNVEKRLKQLQTGSGIKLKLIYLFEGLGHKEKELHEQLRLWRQSGEWFACNRYSVGALPIELYERLPFDALKQHEDQYIMNIKINNC